MRPFRIAVLRSSRPVRALVARVAIALAAIATTGPALATAQTPAQPAPGRITGRVIDAATGQGITGAGVQVVGTTLGAMTGVDGRYTILNVTAGTVTLSVRRLGYAPKTVTGILVPAGGAVNQDVTLETANVELQAVTVTAESERGSVNEALDAQRTAPGIVSSITAEQISKSPDGDAAQAVQRVSGVTVQDGKFVFVRGLGERYTTATLNGARIPSPEPERKVVPLDLFPSGLLQSITTAKTFTPDLPGDFSGAQVDIKTREFPARRSFAYSVGVGANASALGTDLPVAPRVGLEWLGLAGGERDQPSALANTNFFGEQIPATQMNGLINGLRNRWSPNTAAGAPNTSFSASVGGNDPFPGTSQRVGYLASLTYGLSQEVRDDEVRQLAFPTEDGGQVVANRLEGRTGRSSAQWGSLLNLSTLFGSGTRLSLNNTFTRSGDNEAREDFGFNENLGTDLRRQTLRFIERSVRSNQLALEQQFGTAQRLDAQVTSSAVTRREPDRSDIIYLVVEDDVTGEPAGEAIVQNGEAAPRRTFADLDESNLTGSLDWRLAFGETQRSAVKVGAMYRRTERTANTSQFALEAGSIFNTDILNVRGEEIFDGRYTTGDEATFRIQPLGQGGSYDAEDELLAGYAMLEWVPTDRLKIITGARVEQADIRVNTQILGGATIPSQVKNTDVLPSLIVNWQLTDNQAIRVSGTQTLARPEYRELSQLLVRDVLGEANIQGNPNLRRTLVLNGDVKWEWYPNQGEVLSLGVFAKRFDEPIEAIEVITATPLRTFVNTNSAENLGVELELRKNLGFLGDAFWPVSFFSNVTIMRSQIDIGNDTISSLTNRTRAMVGQAPFVVNSGLTYTADNGTSATLLYNVVGRRIVAAGVFPQPDIYELPRNIVDLSLRVPLGERFGLKVDGRNLLDARTILRQGTVDRESFLSGRVFSMGLSWQP